MADPSFRVQVTDLATGEEQFVDVAINDYYLITTGSCEVAGIQIYPKRGTHVITVKGQRATRPPDSQPLAASSPPPEASDG